MRFLRLDDFRITNHFNQPMKLFHKLALLFFVPCTMAAQADQTALQSYFEQSLQGKAGEAPHKKLSMKKVAQMRNQVWNAWKTANGAFSEQRLPQLQPLSAHVSSSWTLPDSLEPSAVMPFYFGSKGVRPEAGYPLFIYLHGSGPKANEWANGLLFGERFADAPSVYFVPQIPNEGKWYRWWQRSKQFAWERLLRQALLSDSIDPSRLYVFGISEGGYGSQRLASFYADYWAGAGPMAGGEPLKNAPAENLGHVAFSLRTGDKDYGFYRNTLSGYVREELDSLEDLMPTEYRHSVTLIPGQGHHIDYTQTTPWLSHFKRNACPSHFIWEDYDMDGRHRSGFYNLLVEKRPDNQRRTRYDVSISKDSNRVDIVIENVNYTTTQRDSIFGIEMKFSRTYDVASGGAFTLFLNEELVNLRTPVRVFVNGRRVFLGTPRLDVNSMARSVAAFYDPRRIFPAAIEVKY